MKAPLKDSKGSKPRKFRNVPTVVDGILFPSKKEARRWVELRALERAGKIAHLTRQMPYRLEVNGQLIATYRPDFEYVENGERVTEDAKGVQTPEFRLKKKLMEAIHGVVIKLT
jgi:hypothetical protein